MHQPTLGVGHTMRKDYCAMLFLKTIDRTVIRLLVILKVYFSFTKTFLSPAFP